MKSSSVLFVGCGDIGVRAGQALQAQGWSVAGVRRNGGKLPEGFTAFSADYTAPGSLDFAEGLAPDFVVTTFNPFDRSEAGYRRGFDTAMANLLEGLGRHQPRHILMASSTRVFAEMDGGWVDESSALSRSDAWAQAIIAAEQRLLESPLSGSIVRFAGIYGIPGGRLISRISRGEICPPQPVRYTNRIHREDCSGFLVHLLQRAAQGGSLDDVYIGVDDRPAPRWEVESWLARQLGVALPEDVAVSEEPIRHNAAGHKRCRNLALTASGYRLVYPDYVAGYSTLLGQR
jgi:nucleoside-diphosphate-sugar epimerase